MRTSSATNVRKDKTDRTIEIEDKDSDRRQRNEIDRFAKAAGYETIIIADHGNADHAINSDGTPNTAHSLNPVPCVYVSEDKAAHVDNGRLADVAPTILEIMGLPQPKEMTGRPLIKG